MDRKTMGLALLMFLNTENGLKIIIIVDRNIIFCSIENVTEI